MNFFSLVFFQPIFNTLIYLYNTLPGKDIGFAIIVLTIIIKLVLTPLSIKMLRGQKVLQELQPKLKALQNKYKNNKEELGRATMELYKREKVNPFSSCLPLLIQLPFLFAVFRVFRDGLKPETLEMLYPAVTNPGVINTVSFGFLDLSIPSVSLAVLTGISQFFQTRMLIHKKQPNVVGAKDEGMMSMMNKQMGYVLPGVTILIGISLPGGLTLYWFIFTLLTILQQKIIFRKNNNKLEDNKKNHEKTNKLLQNTDIIEGEVIKN